MQDRLYKIVEFILNIAEADELEVIQAALHKRLSEPGRGRHMGVNPGRIASESASRISEQVEMSKNTISEMAANFAANIIRQNAPELSEAQVQELLGEFMPESAGGKPRRAKTSSAGASGSGLQGGGLPGGLLVQMVDQFVEYSLGAMSPAEQIRMEEEIPGWKKKYWDAFPEQIRKLISLLLEGEIDHERFSSHIREVLL